MTPNIEAATKSIPPSLDVFWEAEATTTDEHRKVMGIAGIYVQHLIRLCEVADESDPLEFLRLSAAIGTLDDFRPDVERICGEGSRRTDWSRSDRFDVAGALVERLRSDPNVQRLAEAEAKRQLEGVVNVRIGFGVYVAQPRSPRSTASNIKFGLNYIEHLKGCGEYKELFPAKHILTCHYRLLRATYVT